MICNLKEGISTKFPLYLLTDKPSLILYQGARSDGTSVVAMVEPYVYKDSFLKHHVFIEESGPMETIIVGEQFGEQSKVSLL